MDQREGQTFNTALISCKAPQLAVRGAERHAECTGCRCWSVSQSVPPFARIFSFVHSADTLPDMEQIHLAVWGSSCRTLQSDSGMADLSHFYQ